MSETHDYTRRHWGHDFAIMAIRDGGKELRVSGWGLGIETGHYLVLPNGDDTTRYRVRDIEYEYNPRDQWHATLDFAPRPALSRARGETE